MKKVFGAKVGFGKPEKGKEKGASIGSSVGEASSYGTSILGNIKSSEFQLPRSISNIFHKTGGPALPSTLRRKKDNKEGGGADEDLSQTHRAYLAPPMPPSMTSSKLRRVNSSTMSLNRTKKQLLTVEELYVEVLYTILHMIGCDTGEVNGVELIKHVQSSFHMDQEKHEQLLEIATMKEEPYLKTNLEVHEA